MVFTLYSVSLAYILGMVASTFYIRNLKLVGAGFFWMMWLTQVTLSVIAYLTSSGVIKLLTLGTMLMCSLSFSLSVANRKHTKKSFPKSEIVVYLITFFNIVAILFLSAIDTVEGISVVTESVRLIAGIAVGS